jgi:hypothetical protein
LMDVRTDVTMPSTRNGKLKTQKNDRTNNQPSLRQRAKQGKSYFVTHVALHSSLA